ncbi:MAG: hypothetical protein ABI673_09325 [Novosphingobium sp.]
MIHPDKWDPNAFGHEFAFMLIAWNLLEQTAHQLLLARLGGSSEAWMVVTELGNKAIPNAIRSTSKTLESDVLIEHIDHFLKGYESLLTKRNYWTHGLRGVIPETEDNPICAGMIKTFSAKGTMKYSEDRVTVAQLQQFFSDATAFSSFCEAILNELQGENELWAEMREILNKPPPSLERPLLPGALNKQIRAVPTHWLRPEPSPE